MREATSVLVPSLEGGHVGFCDQSVLGLSEDAPSIAILLQSFDKAMTLNLSIPDALILGSGLMELARRIMPLDELTRSQKREP